METSGTKPPRQTPYANVGARGMSGARKETVADRTQAVQDMAPALEMTEALLGGTEAMRKAGKVYLPQWPSEDDDSYAKRLAAATLFPAYSRTVTTLAAKPFSRSITIGDDVPPKIAEWLEDIDLQGRNLDTFAADLMTKQLGCGFVGILVEHKRKPLEARTQADESALGLRPYWVPVHLKQILGWRVDSETAKLTMLRLMECVEEDDGEWGVKNVEQVRVLRQGSWQIHRKNDKGDWVIHDEGVNMVGGTLLNFIPFIPVYGERTGFMTSKPPLLELAHLNIKHWQSQSDQDTLMHVARVPILTLSGVDDPLFKLTIGSGSATKIPHGCDLKYTEHSGAAITSGKVSLDDLKEEMRQSGAELLVLTPGPTTATEIATDNSVGMCALQEMTLALEDAIDQALQITAQWIGEEEGGHVGLFKDFGAATLAEASASLLVGLSAVGKLSGETLISELKRRGILAPEVTWQSEQERLSTEGPPAGFGLFKDEDEEDNEEEDEEEGDKPSLGSQQQSKSLVQTGAQ